MRCYQLSGTHWGCIPIYPSHHLMSAFPSQLGTQAKQLLSQGLGHVLEAKNFEGHVLGSRLLLVAFCWAMEPGAREACCVLSDRSSLRTCHFWIYLVSWRARIKSSWDINATDRHASRGVSLKDANWVAAWPQQAATLRLAMPFERTRHLGPEVSQEDACIKAYLSHSVWALEEFFLAEARFTRVVWAGRRLSRRACQIFADASG